MQTDPVELRRHVGYVIQHVGLFPHQTVGRQRRDGAEAAGLAEGHAPASASTSCWRSSGSTRGTYRDRYPSQLSGGQQQRVGVARALAADPPVLLMDEPFGAIDPVTRARLQQEFLTLQQRLRKTVVLVTHDIDEAVLLGDRIALLEEGGVLAQHGTPDELLTHPASPFVAGFVGHDRGLKRLAVTPIDPAWLEPLSNGDATAVGDSERRAPHLRDGDLAGCPRPGAPVARGRGDRHRRCRPARSAASGSTAWSRRPAPTRGRRPATATLRPLTAPDVLLADVVEHLGRRRRHQGSRSAKIAAVAELLRRVAAGRRSPRRGLPGRRGPPGSHRRRLGHPRRPRTRRRRLTPDARGARGRRRARPDRGDHGPGFASGAGRAAAATCFGRATTAEASFLHRLLLGELRQGALEGVMLDAIAKAAEVPAALVRRALMLGGDLGGTALAALTGGAAALEAVHLRCRTPLRPMLASTAEDVADALRHRRRPGQRRVEARRRPHPGPPSRRRRARSTPATSTTSPTGCPRWWTWPQRLPAERLVLDGETLTLGEDGRPRGLPGHDEPLRRRCGPARHPPAVLLRPASTSTACDLVDLPAGRPRRCCSTRSPARWRIPAIVTDDPATAEAFLDDAHRRRARGRDGQGARLALRGRPAGQGVGAR